MVKVRDAEHATLLAQQLDSILFMGDILISFGDFLENNYKLVPSAYVEEWWGQDFALALKQRYSTPKVGSTELKIEEARLEKFAKDAIRTIPTLSEALTISRVMQVPLHPRYLLYWDQITPLEVISLRDGLSLHETEGVLSIRSNVDLKPVWKD